jgi:hypothetical protein
LAAVDDRQQGGDLRGEAPNVGDLRAHRGRTWRNDSVRTSSLARIRRFEAPISVMESPDSGNAAALRPRVAPGKLCGSQGYVSGHTLVSCPLVVSGSGVASEEPLEVRP